MSTTTSPITSTSFRRQGLYIGGEWLAGGTSTERFDAWTGETIGTVVAATAADARAAVDAAQTAQNAGLPVHSRHAILSGTAQRIASRAEEFAQSIVAETGKPVTAARQEVGRAVETLTLAAEESRRLPGERVPLDAVAPGAGTIAVTIPQPRGVVAAVTPFNFPLNLVVHKIGPAIAAGCAVVLKPSDKAPLVAGLLVDAFTDAGLPPGWLNLVTGDPTTVVDAWQADDRVQVVTFTGSSAVGWSIKAASPRKLHILELGSNTAMVVDHDADLLRAATDAVTAGFGNSGQACVSLQRLYVHKAVLDEFLPLLIERVAALPAGDPRNDDTAVGPLISPAAADKVLGWLDDAVRNGAKIATGGMRIERSVVAPTVITGVSAESPLVCEEVFGPVITVIAVDDIDDAIRRVNDSAFGLNTAIHTASLATALAYAERAESGSVLVNMPPSYRADHMPYGGVKDSGQGREGVKYAVEEMLRQKLVVLKA